MRLAEIRRANVDTKLGIKDVRIGATVNTYLNCMLSPFRIYTPHLRGFLTHKASLPVWLLSARTAMWSMPVVLTETENENYIAKMA